MEQRQALRLTAAGLSEGQVSFVCDGTDERVPLGDLSRNGMRVLFKDPVSIGSRVKGKVEFYFTLTRWVIPFVVKGEVVRVNRHDNGWEAGVKFDELLSGALPA